jgi:predicted RNA methylase
MSLSIVLTIISLIIVAFGIWIIWPTLIGAAFLPTPHKTVKEMLQIAEIKEDDLVYDLGSGDGRIIIEAAQKYGTKAIGIEADPVRVFWSRFNIRSKKMQDRVNVIWGNFFKTNLTEATVITIYQGQDINRNLIEKFKEELKPGTRIVSYSFTFEGWEPVKVNDNSRIYLYKMHQN